MNDTNIPVKDNSDLLGVNIDKNLQFNSQIKNICAKVNNQINVISCFRKKVPTDVKCKLYKALLFHILDIAEQFGTFAELQIELN